MLHARAGYRCARPIPSIYSNSACNARPVHTNGSNSEVRPPTWHVRSTLQEQTSACYTLRPVWCQQEKSLCVLLIG